MALGQECFLRSDDFCKRIGHRDEGFNFSTLDIADEIGEHVWFEHCTAEQTKVFEVKRSKVQVDHGT